MVRVTVWNEYRHEKTEEAVKAVYPQGIHQQIAAFLKEDGLLVETATLDEPEHGLSKKLLEETDVLIWWGHMAHDEVQDEIVERVQQRVLQGMGLIVLHSGHFSKIFKKLMGTSCDLKWREDGKFCRLWNIAPNHRITEDIGDGFELAQEEMYGEHFDIPTPDELIFLSGFPGGEVFRGGCTYHRGKGKIFYFQPGHETYPTYYNEQVQRVIKNSVAWCAPLKATSLTYGYFQK